MYVKNYEMRGFRLISRSIIIALQLIHTFNQRSLYQLTVLHESCSAIRLCTTNHPEKLETCYPIPFRVLICHHCVDQLVKRYRFQKCIHECVVCCVVKRIDASVLYNGNQELAGSFEHLFVKSE